MRAGPFHQHDDNESPTARAFRRIDRPRRRCRVLLGRGALSRLGRRPLRGQDQLPANDRPCAHGLLGRLWQRVRRPSERELVRVGAARHHQRARVDPRRRARSRQGDRPALRHDHPRPDQHHRQSDQQPGRRWPVRCRCRLAGCRAQRFLRGHDCCRGPQRAQRSRRRGSAPGARGGCAVAHRPLRATAGERGRRRCAASDSDPERGGRDRRTADAVVPAASGCTQHEAQLHRHHPSDPCSDRRVRSRCDGVERHHVERRCRRRHVPRLSQRRSDRGRRGADTVLQRQLQPRHRVVRLSGDRDRRARKRVGALTRLERHVDECGVW